MFRNPLDQTNRWRCRKKVAGLRVGSARKITRPTITISGTCSVPRVLHPIQLHNACHSECVNCASHAHRMRRLRRHQLTVQLKIDEIVVDPWIAAHSRSLRTRALTRAHTSWLFGANFVCSSHAFNRMVSSCGEPCERAETVVDRCVGATAELAATEA